MPLFKINASLNPDSKVRPGMVVLPATNLDNSASSWRNNSLLSPSIEDKWLSTSTFKVS